jgi:hypothetical protein
MDKKKKVLELRESYPNLSRKGIADLAQCSPAFVTKTLGSVRPYNKKPKEEAASEIPNPS